MQRCDKHQLMVSALVLDQARFKPTLTWVLAAICTSQLLVLRPMIPHTFYSSIDMNAGTFNGEIKWYNIRHSG